MRSPFAERERGRLIEAILPDVAFDGWSQRALRVAARRIGMPEGAASALFPRGGADLVAAFSRWADHRMLERLEGAVIDELSLSARIALALGERFAVLAPWREAVRRALSVLSLPHNMPLGLRLLYDTVDGIWYAAGDAATDFSFYTKRATLAGIQASATLYWLEDSSPGAAETQAFIARRLDDLHRFAGFRHRLEAAAERLPNPMRVLRPSR